MTMRWLLATWLLTLRCFAADPFFDAQFQALAQFQPGYVQGLVIDGAWYDPGQRLLNGPAISATYDRSGQGNNLTNGTAASQPLISRTDNAGNLLVRSEEFQTTWTKTRVNAFGATDTGATGAGSFANTARTLDPVGGNNADFVQEDGTVASTHLFIQSAIPLTSGTFTFSAYLKRDQITEARLVIQSSPSDRVYCYFNLLTGAVGTAGNVGVASGSVGSILSVGNDWYLCSVTGNPGVSTTTGSVIINLTVSENITFDGDNTSGLFLYGASLRPADWSPTYVPTGATIALPGLNGLATAYFDGVDDYLKSAAFTLNQPTFVVMVAKQVTWTANDTLLDGDAANSGRLYQLTASPGLSLNAGSAMAVNSNMAVGSWSIARVTINGASSSTIINRTTATTGNPGAANMGGFTLVARGDISNFANLQVARVLVFSRIPSAAEQDYIVRGLAVQWGITL